MRTTFVCTLATLAFAVIGCTAEPIEPIGAVRANVCCGATCCNIDAACRSTGDRNPMNPCQECRPSVSQFMWTDIPDCVAPDGGPVEDAGGGDTDAGDVGTDAGDVGTDAGGGGVDAGGGTDAGGGGVDAGTTAPPAAEDDGCGCATGAPGSSVIAALLAGTVLLARRRRRG